MNIGKIAKIQSFLFTEKLDDVKTFAHVTGSSSYLVMGKNASTVYRNMYKCKMTI